jgi:hypothetical protein
MTPVKKLQELLILGAIWAPVAALVVLLVENMTDIGGSDFTVYGLLTVIVAAAFVATELVLSQVHVDTSYSPE